MGVFKEQANFLLELEKRQKQIWNDSCDLGIEKSYLSDDELNRLRDTIELLLDLPGSKVSWRADSPACQRLYQLVIMWGRNDDGKFDATIFKILYFKDNRKEFFSIDHVNTIVNKDGE